MDRSELAQECLAIEKAGGDVLAYLKEKGSVSPWGTWFRLQKDYLGRKDFQITKGRGKDMNLFGSRIDMLDACIQEIQEGRNPVTMLSERGYKSPTQAYTDTKCWAKKNAPEKYAQLPENLRSWLNQQKKKAADGTPVRISEYRPEEAPTMKVDGPLKIETNEPKKIEVVTEQKPLKPGLRGLNNSDFTVSAIKHPQLGEFYYDQKFNSVDWRSPEGEEISLHPAMWKELYMIIPDVMGILGVPDYE
jgi:hypothetical protein